MFLKGDRCNSPKCAMVKRNYPPGQHGPKGSPRKSEYGLQLAEKQKAKKQYGVLEKQFRLTFEKGKHQSGNSGENLLKLLEMRLDNTVYRLGFAVSRGQARQLVGHGHFTVNNKKVDITSFVVKTGDVIGVKESSKKHKNFKDLSEKLKNHHTPGWLHLEAKELTGKVLHQPSVADIQTNINSRMIVEYYSK